ncbi:hypothetical protein CLBADJHJ_01486 [[Clostridium] scindens]|nr:hypothetical protein CLBADJHJ_01486 [[Clostridium] scindens]DAN90169.1 MAG TPA: hypothetical protein [Caudoviricetes sp.]
MKSTVEVRKSLCNLCFFDIKNMAEANRELGCI